VYRQAIQVLGDWCAGTNLLQVAVHEIGHSLGLDHSSVNSAIMAPFYRGYVPNLRLDQDDIDRIRNIYFTGNFISMSYRPLR